MSEYKAPTREMKFVLNDVINFSELTELEQYQDISDDIVDAVLEEGGKFCSEVLSPLNWVGDQEGAVWSEEGVKTATGFKEAYASFVENGWNSVSSNPEFGGQGLPAVFGSVIMEMMGAANTSFCLCPMLSVGAVEALDAHGTEEQKNTYLEKLITGEWTGTMNLTEPQAGSDVGALRSKAEPVGDGSYKISGQKIFITWGEHDCADNIIHLVLARLPDAPKGTKGISLFIVPKFMVNEDGSLGERNDVRCVSIEHKLGIMASPTCVMSFGDNGNCIGYLVGEENKGMSHMFTMMNSARLNVGMLGIANAERAYQMGLEYAKDRVQFTEIINHADVRRMLMTIRASTDAARAITYLNAKALDLGENHPDAEVRRKQAALAELLTPMSKAYSTDLGVENSSTSLQIHGGMGFVEETGIAQIFRDSRIHPIYEGTNGIQAMDLIGRKLAMHGGEHWKALLSEISGFVDGLSDNEEFSSIRSHLSDASAATSEAAEWLLAQHAGNMRNAAAGAVPFLRLFSSTLGAYLLAKGAVSARNRLDNGDNDQEFLQSRIVLAQYYAEQILPSATALKSSIMAGDELFYAIADDHMAF